MMNVTDILLVIAISLVAIDVYIAFFLIPKK